MSPTVIGIICICIMLYFLFTGMNIGLLFLAVGFLGYTLLGGFESAIGLMRSSVYATAASYNYSVVPLFIVMGQFAFHSGITTSLFDTASKWLGRRPGGLASATVVACAAFGAVCGSIAATTATMGQVAVPEMRKHGYDPKLATGCVSAGGTIGILIPPSTPFIVYGICTQLSIGALFAAGILPGLMMALAFIITIVILVKRSPKLAPMGEKYTLKEKIASLKGIIGIAILFGFVFVGMFAGWFTVNEAAAIGTFLALFLMILNRKFTFKTFMLALKESMLSYSMVYIILLGAQVMTSFLAATKLPATLAATVAEMDIPVVVLLAIITIIYMIMGCFIDSISMILLTVPIFYPLITMVDVDPIWFGVLCIIVGQIGAITPPVGMCVYIIGGIAKDVPMSDIFKGIVPFMLAMVVCIVIIIAFPPICTFLPNLWYG